MWGLAAGGIFGWSNRGIGFAAGFGKCNCIGDGEMLAHIDGKLLSDLGRTCIEAGAAVMAVDSSASVRS